MAVACGRAHSSRSPRAAGDLRHQSGLVAPVKAIERQYADLWLADPGHLELRAERHYQQHAQAAHALDGEVEQFARGRVDPMRVLENHDHRLLARQAHELVEERFQCPFLLALRTEAGQRVVFRTWQRQQIGDEGDVFVGRCGARQQRFEFLQSDPGRVFAREPSCSAELLDKRKQRAVLVVGGAEIAQAEMYLRLETPCQRRGDARFADAGFTRDQHNLSIARFGAHPAAQ
jgi:hypothetical protein